MKRALLAGLLAGTALALPTLPYSDLPQEDEPDWDCTSMGNRVCGPSMSLDPRAWHPVTRELGDALAEGDTPDAVERDWTLCWEVIGDTSYVVCPDGTVMGS